MFMHWATFVHRTHQTEAPSYNIRDSRSTRMATPEDKYSFKYVYIPADNTEGIQELTFETSQSDDVMSFLNHLKRHFKQAGGSGTAAQKQAHHQAFRAQMGDKAAGVSDDLLQMLSQQQLVEPIALLANAADSGFIGVYLYCDDQASIKQLPVNQRATAIAAAAGQHLQINGDVFIGRYFDNEDNFKRMDFTAAELSSSAPWISEANKQLQRRSERSGDTQALMQRLQQQQQQQPAMVARQASVVPSPSDAEKAKGNQAVARSDYHSALEHFTAAIKLDPANVAARNNRALAYLKLSMYEEAAGDCSSVLEAESNNVKALLRRSAAYEALDRHHEAVRDLQVVLDLQPNNADAKMRAAALAQKLAAGAGADVEASAQPE